MNFLPERDPIGARAPWSVIASARPARTSSITTGTKEEHQIRVRTEFGVERDRTRVEGDRTRVGEFLFVLIGLVALNQPWHPVYIGLGGLD
jgi:hypothetical protein